MGKRNYCTSGIYIYAKGEDDEVKYTFRLLRAQVTDCNYGSLASEANDLIKVSCTFYYDNYDLAKVDKTSLRRKIGCCLQSGSLFTGDIFHNVTITAPWATREEAWEALRMASLEDDVRKMPMGLFTLVSEGGGGLSGGQKQRILIARALISKPDILFFDEATSALDNISQKAVSDNLDELMCTRVVIAHRLSTIRHCDRIIVLDKGKIAEEGTFDELMENKGLFYEMSLRQI